MTRSFLIETNDKKHAAAAVELSNSAYPGYWGLNILEAYRVGDGLKGVIEAGGDPVPASELSEFASEYDSYVAPRPRKTYNHQVPEYVYIYNTKTSEMSIYDHGVLAIHGNIQSDIEKMKEILAMYKFLDTALSIAPGSRKLELNGSVRLREAWDQYETCDALVAELKAGPKTCMGSGKPGKLMLGVRNIHGERDFLYRYTCYVMSEDVKDGVRMPDWRHIHFELYPQWHISKAGTRFDVGVVTPWGKVELRTPVRAYKSVYGVQVADQTVSQRAGEAFIRDFITQNEANLIRAIPIFDLYTEVDEKLSSMYKGGKPSRDMAVLVDQYKPVLSAAMEGLPEFIPGFTVQTLAGRWRRYAEMRLRLEREIQQAEKGGADM